MEVRPPLAHLADDHRGRGPTRESRQVWQPALVGPVRTPWASLLGPHDPLKTNCARIRFLHDGTGSPFGLLAIFLPGFGGFRYPAKFLTFAAVALAVLAGAGWDRAAAGGAERRRLRRLGWPGSRRVWPVWRWPWRPAVALVA